MRSRIIIPSVLILALGLTESAETPRLPAPYATPSVYRYPQIVAKPAGSTLRVPPGFQVEVFASGFQCPRFMAIGPHGEVLLSDAVRGVTPSRSTLEPLGNPEDGSVYVLAESNQRKRLIGKLYRPYGIAFWHEYIYVAEAESVKRYKYDAKSQSVGTGQEVISLKGLGTFHWTRTLLFGRDDTLYVAIGSGSNHTIGEEPRRATIFRYHSDGSAGEIFAAGLRNPVGMRWYPGTDTMWASVQERDDLGDDLVPDFFTHIEAKGFYGWPYAYIGPHEDPFNSGFNLFKHLVKHPQGWSQAGRINDLIKRSISPDFLLGSHLAVLDFMFYTGSQFPAEYKGGAFLAFHGSSNRSKRVGYSIGFVPFQNGKPSGTLQEFLTGWMLGPESDDVWGRPAGLLQLPDGSLLISDDGGRKIWRVTYRGQ